MIELLKKAHQRACQWLPPHKQWFLLWREGKGEPASLQDFTPLFPPRRLGWADPFPVVRQGRLFVFFEAVRRSPKRGWIAVMERRPDGTWTEPVDVIKRPYHLSYPFVFEHEGQWWMIPESRQDRSVQLFRCTAWPHGWAFEKHLMADVEASDCTLLQHGGRWWLFCAQPEVPGGPDHSRLHLYHSRSPLSAKWTPHPANPVVEDIRSARPAGRIFAEGGKLVRPAQDCSERYGYALRLQEITHLGEKRYAERPLKTYLPEAFPGAIAMHTFNRAGGFLFMDAARMLRY